MQQGSGCSRFHRSCSTQMRRGRGRRQPHEVFHPLPESRLDEQDARFVDALGMRPIPPEPTPCHGPAGERFPVDHHAEAKDDIGGQDEYEGKVGPRHGAALVPRSSGTWSRSTDPNLGLLARTVPALFFCGSIGRWCPESGRQTKYWFPSTTSQRSLSASTVPFQSALGMVLLSPTRL